MLCFQSNAGRPNCCPFLDFCDVTQTTFQSLYAHTAYTQKTIQKQRSVMRKNQERKTLGKLTECPSEAITGSFNKFKEIGHKNSFGGSGAVCPVSPLWLSMRDNMMWKLNNKWRTVVVLCLISLWFLFVAQQQGREKTSTSFRSDCIQEYLYTDDLEYTAVKKRQRKLWKNKLSYINKNSPDVENAHYFIKKKKVQPGLAQ